VGRVNCPWDHYDRRHFLALTVDDRYCDECVAGYVDFAQRTGIHLTFSPDGTYGPSWGKYADTLRPLIE
jgi:hypothetical protein